MRLGFASYLERMSWGDMVGIHTSSVQAPHRCAHRAQCSALFYSTSILALLSRSPPDMCFHTMCCADDTQFIFCLPPDHRWQLVIWTRIYDLPYACLYIPGDAVTYQNLKISLEGLVVPSCHVNIGRLAPGRSSHCMPSPAPACPQCNIRTVFLFLMVFYTHWI